jgi:hypothetical protein
VTNQLDTSLSFDDIAGIDAAKAQVVNLVEVMKNPAKYNRLGARQPTGYFHIYFYVCACACACVCVCVCVCVCNTIALAPDSLLVISICM